MNKSVIRYTKREPLVVPVPGASKIPRVPPYKPPMTSSGHCSPITTYYKGEKFRSRGEARFAAIFEASPDVSAWEYEPENYVGLGYWNPDFAIRHEEGKILLVDAKTRRWSDNFMEMWRHCPIKTIERGRTNEPDLVGALAIWGSLYNGITGFDSPMIVVPDDPQWDEIGYEEGDWSLGQTWGWVQQIFQEQTLRAADHVRFDWADHCEGNGKRVECL